MKTHPGNCILIRDCYILVIDVAERRIDLELSPGVLQSRLLAWRAPPPNPASTSILGKYVRLVSDASQGAVTSAYQ